MLHICGYACTLSLPEDVGSELFVPVTESDYFDPWQEQGFETFVGSGWHGHRLLEVCDTRGEAEVLLGKILSDWDEGEDLGSHWCEFLFACPTVSLVTLIVAENEEELNLIERYHSFFIVKHWESIHSPRPGHTEIKGKKGQDFPAEPIQTLKEAIKLRDEKSAKTCAPWDIAVLVMMGSTGLKGQMKLFEIEPVYKEDEGDVDD